MKRADSLRPIIPKESVQDTREVHSRGHQATDVRNQRDRRRDVGHGCRGRSLRHGRRRHRRGRVEDRIGLTLKGQADVEKGRQRLYRLTMLRVIEKVSLAALISRIPLEDVEIGVLGAV